MTYPEYVEFIGQCIRRDFVLNVTDEECRDIADYVFDKIKMTENHLNSDIMTL